MNLRELSRVITLKEAKKRQVSIAQVKEILRITLKELAKYDDAEIIRTIRRFK